MIIHDASGGMIHGGSPKMSLGSGAKKITARKSPDMLGSKMGTEMVPVRALNAPSTIYRARFRGDAIRDDGRSPNPLFWVEAAAANIPAGFGFGNSQFGIQQIARPYTVASESQGN